MSLGDSRVPDNKAEKEAEKTLRLRIGNLPHLGEYEIKDGEYVFPILVSLPRVIFDQDGNPLEVRFLSEEKIGEIQVNAASGEVTEYTDVRKIESRIDEKHKEIERAVQKALVKSAAKDFSLLPYSAHMYTPVQDLLSELILSEQLSESQLQSMGKETYQKYVDHAEILIEVNLVRKEGNSYVAGDELTEILSQREEPSKSLNKAMTHLFEKKADDLDMMHEIIGPHLKIAGYYYRRAIESERLPEVDQEELKREFTRQYSGEKSKVKGFKMSRYLLQLEQIGLIKSVESNGRRVWKGKPSIRSDVLSQRDELKPIAEISA